MLADARSLALLALAPSALVLADARSLAFLAFALFALVLADARPLAFLAFASYVLVGAHACHSLSFFLPLVWPLPLCILSNRRLHASRFQMARLHQATREGRQRRLQLLPPSMHMIATAAHGLGTCLLVALSLHCCITTLWPCSFPRRYGLLAVYTLPFEYIHQDQGLYSVLLGPRVVVLARKGGSPGSRVDQRFVFFFLEPLSLVLNLPVYRNSNLSGEIDHPSGHNPTIKSYFSNINWPS